MKVGYTLINRFNGKVFEITKVNKVNGVVVEIEVDGKYIFNAKKLSNFKLSELPKEKPAEVPAVTKPYAKRRRTKRKYNRRK